MTAHPNPRDGDTVLHVKVGESLAEAGQRAAQAMYTAQAGDPPTPYFGISFVEVGQLLVAFTPTRWELIAALRAQGPMTVAELARLLGRNYKNVHGDITQLTEWMAVTRFADGKVAVPWSEIIVDMKLPARRAA